MAARIRGSATGARAWRAAFRLAVALAAASASAARADAPAASDAPSGRYAFSAAVRVLADGPRARFEFNGSLYALPIGSGVVDVGAQAREAYAAVERGMFAQPPAADAPLAVEVTLASADLAPGGGAGRAVVEQTVVVRDAAGSEIDRWSVRGDSPIVGYDEAAVSRAFARAVAQAAGAFERGFDGSKSLGAWLSERGLARRTPPPPVSRAVRPPRVGAVSYLETGLAAGTGGVRGAALRAGFSTERWLVAATFERLTGATFQTRPVFLGGIKRSAELATTLAGVDAGGVRRFAHGLELRGGLGARVASGTGTVAYQLGVSAERRMSITKWTFIGSSFAGLQTTTRPWTALRLRARGGVEGRLYVGRPIRFDAYRSDAEPVGGIVLLYLGVELPVAGFAAR